MTSEKELAGKQRECRSRSRLLSVISLTIVASVGVLFASSCADKEEPKNTNAPPKASAPATASSQSNANSAPSGNANAAAPAGTVGKEITTPSGLKYTDLVVGTGESPKTGQQVVVHYTGTFPNGKKFESSRDSGQPIPFRIGVGMVIKGWEEGLMTMRVGGRRKLVCPPELAYGKEGRPGIPPNSTLVFDVELLSVR